MTDARTLEQERQLGRLVRLPGIAERLGERFAAAGHELYAVGGTVRDDLLDRGGEPDLDLATSATPEETRRLVEPIADAIWLTGQRFGTVSARVDGWTVEVTTFRADRYTGGSRHPEVRFGDSIEEDLARRDFTVNAMAVRTTDRRFVDPYGGLADLRAEVLRTPIDPDESFGDDPLRMVRLARFVAEIGLRPAPEAVDAARRLAHRIDEPEPISRERIRDELSRLLCGEHVRAAIDLLVTTGLADRFLPEVPAMRLERDPAHHHKDVYLHTLQVVERTPRDDLVLRLAALLHDVGKPATRRFHPDGTVTFHHHEVVGARMARPRLETLRFSKDVIDDVVQLVELHLRFHGYADQPWTDSGVRRYVRDAGSAAQLRRLNLLTRADVTTGNRAKARRLQQAMDDLEARIAELAEREELERIRPPLDGNQIMTHLGLQPGPLVGEAREHLLEARMEHGPLSEEEGYRLLEEWARERGLLEG